MIGARAARSGASTARREATQSAAGQLLIHPARHETAIDRESLPIHECG